MPVVRKEIAATERITNPILMAAMMKGHRKYRRGDEKYLPKFMRRAWDAMPEEVRAHVDFVLDDHAKRMNVDRKDLVWAVLPTAMGGPPAIHVKLKSEVRI